MAQLSLERLALHLIELVLVTFAGVEIGEGVLINAVLLVATCEVIVHGPSDDLA